MSKTATNPRTTYRGKLLLLVQCKRGMAFCEKSIRLRVKPVVGLTIPTDGKRLPMKIYSVVWETNKKSFRGLFHPIEMNVDYIELARIGAIEGWSVDWRK